MNWRPDLITVAHKHTEAASGTLIDALTVLTLIDNPIPVIDPTVQQKIIQGCAKKLRATSFHCQAAIDALEAMM